jgi:hypothetical protein
MSVSLDIINQEGTEGYSIKLEAFPVLVGSANSCTVVIPDPHVAKKHFHITRIQTKSVIRYRLSSFSIDTPVFVNNESIQASWLSDGDVIQVSTLDLIFRCEGHVDQPAPQTRHSRALTYELENPRHTTTRSSVYLLVALLAPFLHVILWGELANEYLWPALENKGAGDAQFTFIWVIWNYGFTITLIMPYVWIAYDMVREHIIENRKRIYELREAFLK